MTPQTESQLENALIGQLNRLGFSSVTIQDTETLESNLRSQLERFNNIQFTDAEFSRVLNYLKRGDRFAKSKTLRDRFNLVRDDETTMSVRFFNMEHWCKNEYQVTNQITQVGRYENPSDTPFLAVFFCRAGVATATLAGTDTPSRCSTLTPHTSAICCTVKTLGALIAPRSIFASVEYDIAVC